MKSLFLASVAVLLVCLGDFHLLFNALPSQENIKTLNISMNFTIPLYIVQRPF